MSNKPNFSLGCYNLIDKDKLNVMTVHLMYSNDIDHHVYTTPKGSKTLRNQLTSFLEKNWNYKIDNENSDMIITTGSQQSINLLIEALDIPHSKVVIEQPTYFGALSNFKKAKALLPVYINEEGIDLEELRKTVLEDAIDYIYVVPTFNNPTGYSWSLENRLEFLKIVNEFNITVIEDDPYSLINYQKEEYPSLYKLNNGKNIIYLGTLSKYLSPSVTVGFILANKEIINKLYKVKENADLCTNALIQNIVSVYLSNYDLVKDVKDKIPRYKILLDKSQAEIFLKYKALIKKITKPKGGLFYLVYFGEEYDGPISTNEFFLNSKEKVLRVNICYDLSQNKGYSYNTENYEKELKI